MNEASAGLVGELECGEWGNGEHAAQYQAVGGPTVPDTRHVFERLGERGRVYHDMDKLCATRIANRKQHVIPTDSDT